MFHLSEAVIAPHYSTNRWTFDPVDSQFILVNKAQMDILIGLLISMGFGILILVSAMVEVSIGISALYFTSRST